MKDIICIVCPRGCKLHIDNELNVTGNNCPRGLAYALNEIKNPTRELTSFIRLEDNSICSVKTTAPIPKGKMFEVIKFLNSIHPKGPIEIGDIIVKNILDTGCDVVATRNIREMEKK